MTIEDLQNICLKFPATTQDIKWEDHLCFNVGGKIYLTTSPDQFPVSASFKAGEVDFARLTEREGFSPARYLARYKWVQVDDINRLSKDEWGKFLIRSYELVFEKLPTRLKKEINANANTK